MNLGSAAHANRVAVIGGGWAGLAAATELAAAGAAVTVFETARTLGGRAREVSRENVLPGLSLDNGQHILLGAYRETQRLMRQVGLDPDEILLRLPLRLDFPGHLDLRTPALPAPWHLCAGLLGARGLSLRERLAALHFVAALRLAGFRTRLATVAELTAGQPEKLVRLVWEPLCLAALNTPIGIASAQVFLNVLRDSFGRARADSDLLLPRRDLTTLFPAAAAAFVQRHGGSIRLGSTVMVLLPDGDGVLVDGTSYDHAVVAVGPHAAQRLLAPLPRLAVPLAAISRMDYQPIATVYLQYPAHVKLAFPMQGMLGGHGQWVLDRGVLCGQPGLLAVVVSAEGPHLQLGHVALAQAVHAELDALLGPLPAPLGQQVIVEKRATFACTAGLQRPACTTPEPRILLAGDYTAGDYPATLEGAVRSGVQCAQLLLERS